MEHVISMSRARRVASRDAGQLLRAVASLLGLAVAIAAAVGLGSMMGGSEPRIPVAQDPVVSDAGDIGGPSSDTSGDALDTLFGGQGGAGNQTGDNAGPGDAHNSQGGSKDPRDGVDVDLPNDETNIDPPGPVEVPVTPTLPDADLDAVIGDLTEEPPDPGLIGEVLEPVTGLVGDLLN